MKNRKLTILLLTFTMMFSLIGCENKDKTENVQATENVEKEVSNIPNIEPTEEETIVPTSTYDGLTFIEPSGNGDYCFDVSQFDKDIDISFETPKDLDLYSSEGIKIAEVKKGVKLHAVKASSRYAWYELENPVKNTPYDKLYLLEDDEIDVAMAQKEEETTKVEENTKATETNENSSNVSSTKETTKKDTSTTKKDTSGSKKDTSNNNNNTNSNSNNNNNSNNSSKEEQPTNSQPTAKEEPKEEPATNNKYTPDEAVAYYRSQIEAQGMQWTPSIKDEASWGTGWIPLSKDELNASYIANEMAGFNYGDGVGDSYTRYYMEVTSSNSDKVYVTIWVA